MRCGERMEGKEVVRGGGGRMEEKEEERLLSICTILGKGGGEGFTKFEYS